MNDNGVYTGLNVEHEQEAVAPDEKAKQEEQELSDVIRLARKQLLEMLAAEIDSTKLITDLPDPAELPANLGPTDIEVMARKRYINLIDSLIYRLGAQDD